MSKKLLLIYFVTFVVAACSILYELLLANSISLIAGSTVVWYSVTIGVYLGAMGVGAFYKDKIFADTELSQKLFNIEVILSILGGMVAALVSLSYSLSVYFISLYWGQMAIAFFFFMGITLVFAVGFLSGIELPLLMEIGNDLNKGKRRISNRILGADYFGSLAGAVLFPIVLVPNLSSYQIGFIVALANVVMALVVLLSLARKKNNTSSRKIIGLIVLFVLVFGLFRSWQIEQFFAKKYYYYLDAGESFGAIFSKMKDYPDIERIRSPYQQIDIMEPVEFGPSDFLVGSYFNYESNNDIIDERMVFLNGDWQFATYVERVYHEYFAHVPMGVSENVPKKVLVLGGGDGMLIRELLKYSEIGEIVHVELDGKMIELAKQHPILSTANKNSLHNEKVDTIVDDAFRYVKRTEREFDAIYIDFPVPADYNISKVYSREFYFFVEDCLADDGFLVMYAPGVGSFSDFNEEGKVIPNEELSPWFQYYHTLKSAGFQTIVPYLSLLEVDNPNAWEVAGELVDIQEAEVNKGKPIEEINGLTEEERWGRIEKMVRAHVLSLAESFIIARKDEVHVFGVHEHDVETIIGPKRIHLAFDVPFTKDEEVNWRYVNSIMKPTLPHFSVWRIRFPYKIN
ncbi:MAG: hypothetical protein U9O20_01390 [Patescibacteria group bacterium]|nr:hypothetical protein [Patescibacteria group bacterium]